MPLIKKNKIHFGNHVEVIDGEGHVHEKAAGALDEAGESPEIIGEVGGAAVPQPEVLTSEEKEKIKGDIIAQARKEAEAEKKKILEDIEKEREASNKAGFEEGKKEALEKYVKSIKEAQSLLEQGNIERTKIVGAAEPEVLKLSVKIATQIIKSEVTLNPDVTLNIVREAINKISDNKNVVIKVNQNDLETVRDQKDEIEDLIDSKNITIVSDKKVEAGGCYIETSLGYIDARIATKLAMIEDALLDIYEKDTEEAREKLELDKKKSILRTTQDVDEEEDEAGDIEEIKPDEGEEEEAAESELDMDEEGEDIEEDIEEEDEEDEEEDEEDLEVAEDSTDEEDV